MRIRAFTGMMFLIVAPWVLGAAETPQGAPQGAPSKSQSSESLTAQLSSQALQEGWLNLPALAPNILMLTKTSTGGDTKSYLSVQQVRKDSRITKLEKRLNAKAIKKGEKFGYLILTDDPEFTGAGIIRLQLQEGDTKATREQTWFFGKKLAYMINEWGPERVSEKTRGQIKTALANKAGVK